MNLFTGMTDHEKVSALMSFLLFNGFVVLEAFALGAFYVASRPRRGRVRTAAIWHIFAAILFILSLITTVWAAPAEKSFIDESGSFFAGDRFTKVLIGLFFAAIGIAFMMAGAIQARHQRARAAQDALFQT